MTEEIIIDCAFYKDGVCASPINKTCEYCKNIDMSKCYHKQLKRLEQENKLKKIQNEELYSDLAITNMKLEKYKSVLEEIRENLVKLKTNDEDDFTYEYSKIEDKINECLGE